MKLIISVVLFSSLLSFTAIGVEKVSTAQKHSNDIKNAQFPHIYLGGRLGWGFFQDSCSNYADDCNDDTLGGGLYLGYQLNHWFALEGGLTDYGKANARYNTEEVNADTYGAELSGKFSYAISSRWSIFSRLGASYQYIEKSSSWEDKQESQNWNALAAVGLDYYMSPDWSLRAEYQYIDGIGDKNTLNSDLHFTSVGVTYHFGQKARPVAPPPPEPVPESVIPKSFPENPEPIKLASDGLFAIDSYQLKYNPALSSLAQSLTRYPDGQIYITGYTDNTGSKAHNQRLSEQRAHSVAEYLQHMGINEDRLVIIGKGESSPIADNNTSEGRQKNRRVEVRFQTVEKQQNKEQ